MSLDAIANVTATCSSAAIAGAALYFSHLQNAGWRPLALFGSASLGGEAASTRFYIRLHVEFWNRRRHPVVLNEVQMKAKGLKPSSPLQVSTQHPAEILWVQDYGWRTLDTFVDPATRHSEVIDVYFECEDLEKLKAEFDCTVVYYDPLKGKKLEAKLTHRFMYPGGLGWTASPDPESWHALTHSVIGKALSDQTRAHKPSD